MAQENAFEKYHDELEYLIELIWGRMGASLDYESYTITLKPRFEKPFIRLTISLAQDQFKVIRAVYESDEIQLVYDDMQKSVVLNLNSNIKLSLSYTDPGMSITLSKNDLEFFTIMPTSALMIFLVKLLPIDTEVAGILYNDANEADKQILEK